MLLQIPAGKLCEIDQPGRFFHCRSANGGFKLRVFTRTREYEFDIEEEDSFELPNGREFTKLVIDNLAGTDKLTVTVNVSDFRIDSNTTRVPPTQTNPFTATLMAVTDYFTYGGNDDTGRRRMKITLGLVDPTAGTVYVYKGEIGDVAVQNLLFVLDSTKPVWSEHLDCKVTAYCTAGAPTLFGYEVNMQP